MVIQTFSSFSFQHPKSFLQIQKANPAHDQIQNIASTPLHQRNKIPPYIF